jgi:hypothetical protein
MFGVLRERFFVGSFINLILGICRVDASPLHEMTAELLQDLISVSVYLPVSTAAYSEIFHTLSYWSVIISLY